MRVFLFYGYFLCNKKRLNGASDSYHYRGEMTTQHSDIFFGVNQSELMMSTHTHTVINCTIQNQQYCLKWNKSECTLQLQSFFF